MRRFRITPSIGIPVIACNVTGVLCGKHDVLKCLSRSITDRSKILMASFCEKDIPEIIENISVNSSKKKRVNRIRSGISDFLQSVCDDLAELYPNIYSDSDLVLRLFKRLLTKTSETADPESRQ